MLMTSSLSHAQPAMQAMSQRRMSMPALSCCTSTFNAAMAIIVMGKPNIFERINVDRAAGREMECK